MQIAGQPGRCLAHSRLFSRSLLFEHFTAIDGRLRRCIYVSSKRTCNGPLRPRRPQPRFPDLRSASQAIRRDKTTRQKYYNFKHVKPGDIGALRCESVGLFEDGSENPTEGDRSIITKSELYKQAQLPPRPPKYHRRHIDKIRGTICLRVDARREARKHGKAIMEGHLRDL